jgi:tRNA modification GTPase
MPDTIFALSSGAPPAAVALIRVSGPQAGAALTALAGRVPPPRRAVSASLRSHGELLDRALVLWLPGPGTATGEDIAELHCHGGRAVVAAVTQALGALPGLRAAEPGEFTRRAFANGRIDLAEAEGLADLLSAETELQRRSAIALAEGELSRAVQRWREKLLGLSAAVEAVLDFGDEDDVAPLSATFRTGLDALRVEIGDWLARPRAEALREGFKVAVAGPPNAGKSTLFNALVEEDAAIATPIAGTTRDVLIRSVSIAGVPFQFFDTAGLRDDAGDAIEAIGIERAHRALSDADLVLWLGEEAGGPVGAWEIAAQCDRTERSAKQAPRHTISALTGTGVAALREDLIAAARFALPVPGVAALNRRQAGCLQTAHDSLASGAAAHDPLLAAEELRLARLAFDTLIGKATTEDMLDALFGRFCIGK